MQSTLRFEASGLCPWWVTRRVTGEPHGLHGTIDDDRGTRGATRLREEVRQGGDRMALIDDFLAAKRSRGASEHTLVGYLAA